MFVFSTDFFFALDTEYFSSQFYLLMLIIISESKTISHIKFFTEYFYNKVVIFIKKLFLQRLCFYVYLFCFTLTLSLRYILLSALNINETKKKHIAANCQKADF